MVKLWYNYYNKREEIFMRLIVTDLDGTLLRSDKSVSARTVEAFKRCKEKGILIGFASSRAASAMTRFIDAINPDFLIASGGATVSVGGNIIHESFISEESVKKILSMSLGFTGGTGQISLDCADGYYCNFIHTDPDRGATAKYSDFVDFDTPCYKITSVLERDEWVEQILSECADCFYVSYTGEIWRKFAARGADKGNALRVICDHYGIDISNTVAFGDDCNDIEMLSAAGTAVAMGNAIDKVKEIADVVTDTNDNDGIAAWIESNI